MKHFLSIFFLFISSLLITGCASTPMYSSQLLVKSAQEELQSANALVEEAKRTYHQYVGAHKHMIATRSLQDKEKMRLLHADMKLIREQAKAIYALRKKIQKDNELLEKELATTPSVSKGSSVYNKIGPLVEIYGNGERHPGIEKARVEFNQRVKNYTLKVGEYSGYLTDGETLKNQVHQKLKNINSKLDKLVVSAKKKPGILDKVSQLKLEISDLQSSFASEAPSQPEKMLLFPNMISYSILDRMSALDERVSEIQKQAH